MDYARLWRLREHFKLPSVLHFLVWQVAVTEDGLPANSCDTLEIPSVDTSPNKMILEETRKKTIACRFSFHPGNHSKLSRSKLLIFRQMLSLFFYYIRPVLAKKFSCCSSSFIGIILARQLTKQTWLIV